MYVNNYPHIQFLSWNIHTIDLFEPQKDLAYRYFKIEFLTVEPVHLHKRERNSTVICNGCMSTTIFTLWEVGNRIWELVEREGFGVFILFKDNVTFIPLSLSKKLKFPSIFIYVKSLFQLFRKCPVILFLSPVDFYYME